MVGHHHNRFCILCSVLAWVGGFLPIKPLHWILFCAHSALRPPERRSCLTHSHYIFIVLPLLFGPGTSKFLQSDIQSFLSFRSRCPNHLSRPRLTISATPMTPNLLFQSSLDILLFKLKPQSISPSYVPFFPIAAYPPPSLARFHYRIP